MIHQVKKSMGLNKFSSKNLLPETFLYRPKKSLGQNFLKSKEALLKICEASNLGEDDTILEIGPGKGVLTEKLLEKSKLVIAVEKDRDLIKILKERFKDEIKNNPTLENPNGRGKLILLNEDILELQITNYQLLKYKIVANIPYNITGLIIRKFLSEDPKPISMTLLVQKEVAERIVARDGKESILSLSVRAYGEPKYIMKVHKRFFSPSPKVDSAIIHIGNIGNKYFKNKNEEGRFFKLIKTSFAHKRKVLHKNMEDLQFLEVGLPEIREKIDEIFEKLEINPKARAEDIKFEKWIEIHRLFMVKN